MLVVGLGGIGSEIPPGRGSEGIVALVDDIAAAHMSNPAIKARCLPYAADPERLGLIEQHLCAFLEAGSGGAAQYTGRSMPDAHRGMNISEAEYMAAINDILAVLRKHDIGEQTTGPCTCGV